VHEAKENEQMATKQSSRASTTRTPAASSKAAPKRTESHADWRADTLAEVRRIIHSADAHVVEERKWAKASNPDGVPVWSHDGIICTGETYKQSVKLTFAKGASLDDPRGLFNSSLDGGTRRAIDIHEGDKIDARGLKALVKAAVALNSATKKK
jgi:hypothetical protein